MKQGKALVDSNLVDDAAVLVSGDDEEPLDSVVANRIRTKIDWHLLPLMMGECAK